MPPEHDSPPNTMPTEHYASGTLCPPNTMPPEHCASVQLCPQNTIRPGHLGPRTLCPRAGMHWKGGEPPPPIQDPNTSLPPCAFESCQLCVGVSVLPTLAAMLTKALGSPFVAAVGGFCRCAFFFYLHHRRIVVGRSRFSSASSVAPAAESLCHFGDEQILRLKFCCSANSQTPLQR